MLTTVELCEHLMGLLHTPIRHYDSEGHCIEVFQDHGEQQDPLCLDTVFLQELLALGRPDCPAVYCEFGGVLYGIVVTPQEGTLILGPSALTSDSLELAAAVAAQHKLDPNFPYRISHTTLETFCQGISMIFHHCTGQRLSWDQIVMSNFQTETQKQVLQEKIGEVCYHFQEQGKVHNPYSQEKWEQDCIRRGDLEGLQKSFQETYVGEVGLLSQNPVRQARNISIVLVTLSTRSAIEGSLPSEIAYSLSDAFIQRVEELNQPTDIYSAARAMEVQLAKMVQQQTDDCKQRRQSSLTIRCKKEILPRLHQKITVKELAQVLQVTPDYLSHVFAIEEGMPLLDYIAREKVRYAQWRLTFTQESYQSIAYAYGFSDQSHFGKVFKKWTGMTPRQYRTSTQPETDNLHKNSSPGLNKL